MLRRVGHEAWEGQAIRAWERFDLLDLPINDGDDDPGNEADDGDA